MKPTFALATILLGAAPLSLIGVAHARPATVKVHAPKPGSRERAAITDAARVPVGELFQGRRVHFVGVKAFRVGGGWAHFYAQTFDDDGQRLEPDGDDNSTLGVTMLLHLEAGRWEVLEWAYVADVIEIEWAKAHSDCPLSVLGLKPSDLR